MLEAIAGGVLFSRYLACSSMALSAYIPFISLCKILFAKTSPNSGNLEKLFLQPFNFFPSNPKARAKMRRKSCKNYV